MINSWRCPPGRGTTRNQFIVFEGMQGHFKPLHSHREYIISRLHHILSKRVKRRLASSEVNVAGPHITVHVRRGDKTVLDIGEPQPKGEAARTPHLSWFANAIKSIREHLGEQIPARVFSEVGPDQLKELLDLPAVTLSPPSVSIVDILLLSRKDPGHHRHVVVQRLGRVHRHDAHDLVPGHDVSRR